MFVVAQFIARSYTTSSAFVGRDSHLDKITNANAQIDTLLKLIAYQQQNPQASDIEIAHGLGISPGYVYRCKKEISLLRHQLAETDLQPE